MMRNRYLKLVVFFRYTGEGILFKNIIVREKIKENLGFRQFSLRGLEGARIEINIVAIIHNLKKIWKMSRENGKILGKLKEDCENYFDLGGVFVWGIRGSFISSLCLIISKVIFFGTSSPQLSITIPTVKSWSTSIELGFIEVISAVAQYPS